MTISDISTGMPTMTSEHTIVDGARLAFTDSGAGEPVVFVHGTPSHSYLWRNIAPAVQEAGYRTIVYDLLGYGNSERPVDRDTSVAAQAELLDKLLEQRGIPQANIIAHDIGGAIGQIIAVRHPRRVKNLMLIDTVTYDSWPSETWSRIIRDNSDDHYVRDGAEFEAMLRRQLEMTVSRAERMSGEVLESYLAPHAGAIGRTSFFSHQVRHYNSRYTQEIAEHLPGLTMPVRVVWGADDQWQPVSYAQRLCRDIPGATLSVIPGAGHFLPEDAPEKLTNEILAFLAP